MVKVIINGKETIHEFPNMAHALAFAYQNGECYAAQNVEIVDKAPAQKPKAPKQEPVKPAVASPAKKQEPDKAGETPGSESQETNANPDATSGK